MSTAIEDVDFDAAIAMPTETAGYDDLPQPRFLVLCLGEQEWRRHAEIVAGFGEAFLLVGEVEEEIVAGFGRKGFEHREVHGGEAVLFWRPTAALI